jgi:2-octaprenyl-6-methoxyphenol hydroxylase
MGNENKILDFVIIGSGITADLLSIILSSSNKNFCHIGNEKVTKSVDFVRSIALSPSTLKMLNYLNIKFPYQDVEQMNVVEGGLSDEKVKGNLIFDKSNNNNQSLAYVAKYNDIKAAIQKEKDSKIKKLHYKSLNYIKIKPKNINIILEKEEKIITKNLIFTKKLEKEILNQFNLKYDEKDYNQKSIVATLEHNNHHKNIAYQYYYKGNPLAILPLESGKKNIASSMIWSGDSYFVDDILANEDLEVTLNALLPDLFGQIKISEGPVSFELKKYLIKGKKDDRLIFIGDAARMMHPMAGQAWNQSIRDISYIADAIAESDNLGINIISTPSYMAFKRLRKMEGVSMVNSIDFINNVYNSNSSISKGFRRNIMKLLNSSTSINSFLIKEAEGGIIRRTSLLLGKKPGSIKF